jgi:2-dehydro-3-deoxy-D-gluconate 5-dehydrogenase
MAHDLFSLAGKVAVVTGGNGGIGLGIAHGLAAAGADIVIAARNLEKSAAAAQDLARHGRRIEVLSVDVADDVSCTALVKDVEARLGRLDILINNAGVNTRKPPDQLTPAEWRNVLAINLDGAFYCARAAHPLLSRRGGKIINIGSMLSIFGTSFAPAYGASKGGIVQLTKSLAAAWAKDAIQVNAILPGWIDTELTIKARQDVEGLHDRVLQRTPAGRWGTPGDFSGVGIFLASAASDFVTGTTVTVDGGFSCQG